MDVMEMAGGEERAWNLVALGSTVLAGIAVRQLLQSSWETVTKEEPPTNPAAVSVSWAEALTWATAVGAAVGAARVLAERGAAAGWKKARGSYPEGLT